MCQEKHSAEKKTDKNCYNTNTIIIGKQYKWSIHAHADETQNTSYHGTAKSIE